MGTLHDLTFDFTEEQLAAWGYVYSRKLANGDWAGIMPMTFGKGRLCTGLNHGGYEDGWCYEVLMDAVMALANWDTEDAAEPEGWFRHPFTGRRRPDGDKSREYVAL